MSQQLLHRANVITVFQLLIDFQRTRLQRVTFAVKEDETANPIHAGLFGADAVMNYSAGKPHPLQ